MPSTMTWLPTSGDASPVPCTWAIVWVTATSQPTGSGSGSGSPPLLRAPKLDAAGARQVPSIFWSDWPSGVDVVSATPMSVAACPFAGPPTPVMPPS